MVVELYKPKILITPQAFETLGNEIEKILGEKFRVQTTNGQLSNKAETIKILKDYDGCIIGSEKVDEEVLESCPNIKILSRFGSGYNSIDLNSAKNNKVIITYVPNENPRAVARHTLGLMLSLTNNILQQDSLLKDGKWVKSL